MLVVISKEQYVALLQDEIKSWECVGGGPNLDAFDFDPRETDPRLLMDLGYYDNREAWIAGVRIKELRRCIDELNALPQFTGR